MTQHFVSQVRKFPDFLTISKRTVAAVPGEKNQGIGFQFFQKIVYCVSVNRF